MEGLTAMMLRLGGTDPRVVEERRQREEARRKDEENRHLGAAGRPTGDACLI